MRFLLIFSTFLSALSISHAGNILYLSNVPSPSHFIWCKSILNSLHERGHNITALSGDVEKSRPNMTYLHMELMYPELYNGTEEIDFFKYGKMSSLELLKLYSDLSEKACVGSLKSEGYQQLLNYPDNFKVDLVIYDYTMGPCVLGFLHKFGMPTMMAVSPFNGIGRSIAVSGTTLHPAFIPGHDLLFPAKMNFKQRLISTVVHVSEYLISKYYMLPPLDKMVHKVHPNAPGLSELELSAKLVLINSNPITDYKEPVSANVKLVGGAQIKTPKELPTNLKEAADNAKNGLVLFSLGTNVRSDTLGVERIVKILKALSRLSEYTFFWKFETSEKLPVALPKNVIIQAWMPQNDILAHPNTKLFISHCGLLSTQESLWYGVPILGLPIFGDQPQNIFRLKELGVGESLSIQDFTENELYDAIRNMLENPKYQKNIKAISSALQDQPMTPNEEATYWAEWIMRHPNINLQGQAAQLSLIVRHSLDVFAAFLIVLLISGYIELRIIIFLIRKFVFNDKKSQVGSKKKTN